MHFCNHIITMQWLRFVKLTALPPVMNKVTREEKKKVMWGPQPSLVGHIWWDHPDPFHYRWAPHLWKVKFAFLCLDQIYQKSHNGRWLYQHAVEGEKKIMINISERAHLGHKENHIWPVGHMWVKPDGEKRQLYVITWVLKTKTCLNPWCYHLTSSRLVL